MNEKSVLIVKKENEEKRLDKFLFRNLKNISYANIQKLIRKGYIKVNLKKKKASYKVQTNDKVFFNKNLKTKEREVNNFKEIYKKEIVLLKKNIIYEDRNILVLNKPQGIPVQGGTKIKFNVDLVLKHINNNDEELKLVHRIDKNTSGLLLIAKSKDIASKLSVLFKQNKISKTYLSICIGKPYKKQGKITLSLGKTKINGKEIMAVDSKKSKPSETVFKVLKSSNNLSLLMLKPKTGRTHQIRAHLKEIGIPILGDRKYFIVGHNKNNREKKYTMHLHSWSMSFFLEKKKYNFNAKLPDYFIKTLKENQLKIEEY